MKKKDKKRLFKLKHKLIIILLFIFFLGNNQISKKFNINANNTNYINNANYPNISSIINSKNIINNSNISIIANQTNLLNTLNISNLYKQINNNNTMNKNKKINFDFNKYKEYFQNSKEGKILYNENLVYSQNPLISVVIPLYNDEKYINATLKSVQNQKMKDIEIILIDDFSTDNSAKYVEESQKKDPRILLIKNKKNMGILYTKSIGVLKARGKYIFPLDDDDMIIIDDLFIIFMKKLKWENMI